MPPALSRTRRARRFKAVAIRWCRLCVCVSRQRARVVADCEIDYASALFDDAQRVRANAAATDEQALLAERAGELNAAEVAYWCVTSVESGGGIARVDLIGIVWTRVGAQSLRPAFGQSTAANVRTARARVCVLVLVRTFNACCWRSPGSLGMNVVRPSEEARVNKLMQTPGALGMAQRKLAQTAVARVIGDMERTARRSVASALYRCACARCRTWLMRVSRKLSGAVGPRAA
jgi:hypothetical protein